MAKYLCVMLGGALGAVSRFAMGTLIQRLYSVVFPLGTFFINVTGSFLIGLLMMLFLNRPGISANWRLFLVTGILGGYTTFSTFEWETFGGSAGRSERRSGTERSLKCWLGLRRSLAWSSDLKSNLVPVSKRVGRILIYSAMTDQTWTKSD